MLGYIVNKFLEGTHNIVKFNHLVEIFIEHPKNPNITQKAITGRRSRRYSCSRWFWGFYWIRAWLGSRSIYRVEWKFLCDHRARTPDLYFSWKSFMLVNFEFPLHCLKMYYTFLRPTRVSKATFYMLFRVFSLICTKDKDPLLKF